MRAALCVVLTGTKGRDSVPDTAVEPHRSGAQMPREAGLWSVGLVTIDRRCRYLNRGSKQFLAYHSWIWEDLRVKSAIFANMTPVMTPLASKCRVTC
jgi:hypothetical protein